MLTRLIAHHNRSRKSRAQGLVEFALILPVMLLTISVRSHRGVGRKLLPWRRVQC
jgi:hypothetical protein